MHHDCCRRTQQCSQSALVLQAAEKVFGVDVNAKGYKVPRGCGVIQGDGIKYERLASMLEAVLEAGYSAEVKHRLCPF